MKIKHIFIGLGALSLLAGCNDYLDVDAPSKYDNATVFNFTTTADKALNGVYATILVDNSFGNTLYNSLQLNSDVDFSSNANETSQKDAPRRFDMTADAGSTEKLWNALYKSVESANEFVYNIERHFVRIQEVYQRMAFLCHCQQLVIRKSFTVFVFDEWPARLRQSVRISVQEQLTPMILA